MTERIETNKNMTLNQGWVGVVGVACFKEESKLFFRFGEVGVAF